MNFRRLGILIVKERKQLLRDRSSVIMGILLPVFLLLLFGYGLSLDIRSSVRNSSPVSGHPSISM